MTGAGIRIVKMSGAGNDFVLLGPEESRQIAGREEEWARRVCLRGLSVGADGILLVEAMGRDRIRVRFHNPDGSSAFCGNGSRCAARFAHARGLAGARMTLETAYGEVAAEVFDDLVRLTLDPPVDGGELSLEIGGDTLAGRTIAAGVPHFVVSVGDPAEAPLEHWGPAVRGHAIFGSDGTNLDVVGRRADGAVTIRTWERGVERETLACGSGAVAAALVARLGGAAERVSVIPASGARLEVDLPGPPHAPEAARLTGDARFVLEGRLDPEALAGLSNG
jgi:diaminopimelate epimerase